ncbi:hypothetical protein PUN28_017650 [Cardiocondyla obscurior]|uniref:Uncharacterized protein n=1 Tax=Cardiocondyla obscurior TaxID=286306 RepID=A0AAW2EIF5_9HYME
MYSRLYKFNVTYQTMARTIKYHNNFSNYIKLQFRMNNYTIVRKKKKNYFRVLFYIYFRLQFINEIRTHDCNTAGSSNSCSFNQFPVIKKSILQFACAASKLPSNILHGDRVLNEEKFKYGAL